MHTCAKARADTAQDSEGQLRLQTLLLESPVAMHGNWHSIPRTGRSYDSIAVYLSSTLMNVEVTYKRINAGPRKFDLQRFQKDITFHGGKSVSELQKADFFSS